MSSKLKVRGHARDGDSFTLLLSNGSTCFIRPERKHAAVEEPVYCFSKAFINADHGLVQHGEGMLVVGGKLTFEVLADDNDRMYATYKGQVS